MVCPGCSQSTSDARLNCRHCGHSLPEAGPASTQSGQGFHVPTASVSRNRKDVSVAGKSLECAGAVPDDQPVFCSGCGAKLVESENGCSSCGRGKKSAHLKPTFRSAGKARSAQDRSGTDELGIGRILLGVIVLFAVVVLFVSKGTEKGGVFAPRDKYACPMCDETGTIIQNGPKRCPLCEGDGRLDR